MRSAGKRSNQPFGFLLGAAGGFLALALEFPLRAAILSTAVAPSWQQIGKLGAISVIRTGLNFFLFKEVMEKQATSSSEKRVQTETTNE